MSSSDDVQLAGRDDLNLQYLRATNLNQVVTKYVFIDTKSVFASVEHAR
jgi:hypothetical protein